ncbi:hypothetical protein JOD29_000838 [Lysinibacillus composti]|uniref:Uncharacterized protein n=1 Tax=Lysinibacillus composti TaxID=720633 RepID=A0A3N9UTU2_9BACI|nr:hypothetical protein [Lysinibacillus composti]MBM7607594.1 hypothetical protein [Lysinibacillus composti]RQW75902.1 hypothetical protein EBB45_04610 [Lysinibacillus composti]
MSNIRKIVPISLNLEDETESKLFEHLNKKGNRSRYLKRLIYDDLMQVGNLITTTVQVDDIDFNDAEAMESFL